MKLLIFKIIFISCVLCRYIESSQAPQSSKQDSQQMQISPRLLPFLEGLSSPDDFHKPLPTSQKCWKKFNNTNHTAPALMDLVMCKRAAPLIEIVLAKNPDLRTIRTESHQNIFHRLAEYGPAANMRRILAYCKEHEYDVAALINEQDNSGATPTHLAAKSCKTHCLQLLIENGAHLNTQDSAGDAPLHYAARTNERGNKKRNLVVRILCRNNVDINIENTAKQAAYTQAFSYGHMQAACAMFTTQRLNATKQ